MVKVDFDTPLTRAEFLERPNRFMVRCRIIEGEKEVLAHLPDPGRLKELLRPHAIIWLKPSFGSGRKTAWSAMLVEDQAHNFVSLLSTLPNQLIGQALREKKLSELTQWEYVRSEYKRGASRWDFLLQDSAGRRMILEVKSVTLFRNGIGFFPDAVSRRASRHLEELAAIAAEPGWCGAVLFAAQRNDVAAIRPAEDIDPLFAERLRCAAKAGVTILGRECPVNLSGIQLGPAVPVISGKGVVEDES